MSEDSRTGEFLKGVEAKIQVQYVYMVSGVKVKDPIESVDDDL